MTFLSVWAIRLADDAAGSVSLLKGQSPMDGDGAACRCVNVPSIRPHCLMMTCGDAASRYRAPGRNRRGEYHDLPVARRGGKENLPSCSVRTGTRVCFWS